MSEGTVWVEGKHVGTILGMSVTPVRPPVSVPMPAWRDSATVRSGTMQIRWADPLFVRGIMRYFGMELGSLGPWWARAVGRAVAWWCVWDSIRGGRK